MKKEVEIYKIDEKGFKETYDHLKKTYKRRSMNDIYTTLLTLLQFHKKFDLLEFFLEHKEEFEKKDYVMSMRIHLLIATARGDELYLMKIRDEYLSAPYRSQEVEEYLRHIDVVIQNERNVFDIFHKPFKTKVNIDEVVTWINSDKREFVNKGVRFLYALKHKGVLLNEAVAKVLEKYEEFNYCFFSLFLYLMSNDYDATYYVSKDGVPLTLNTLEIYKKFGPIEKKIYARLRELKAITKDIGIYRCAEFINQQVMYWLVPDWLDEFNLDAYIYGVYAMANTDFADIYSFEEDPIADVLKFDFEDGKKYIAFVDDAYRNEVPLLDEDEFDDFVPPFGY